MKKYKICVYAITKNEEKFVKRWFDSMKEADEIFVLDTGSTDNTVKMLKELGVNVVKKEIIPWRFDVARNESLEMVPQDYDVCVCTDLDEVFDKGWRKKIEENWDENTTHINYTYNWSLDENNKPLISFYKEKIHSRKNFSWVHPVHEVLQCSILENAKTIDEIVLNHYPDSSKSRSSYLKLLELSVKESPEDDRNMHYLGREYMYYKKWNKCIDTLIKHLNLKSAVWKDERCASMRYIARSYINLKRYDEARMWLKKAILEAPYLRDSYIELALLEEHFQNYEEVKNLCEEALKIKNHNKSYINEVNSWNETVYDLLSIAYFYLKDKKQALKNVNLALKINSKDKRIINNKKLIEKNL